MAIFSVNLSKSLKKLSKLRQFGWKWLDFANSESRNRCQIFFQTQPEKEFIDKSFKKLEKLFNNKIVTLVWKFEKFYPAEDYHQDYYEKNFIRYLMYKKGCKREDTLRRIWN